MLHPATTVTAIVTHQAVDRGDAIALRSPGDGMISYRDLAARTAAVAASLAALGVGRSDNVLVPAANTADAVVALLGAMSVGVAVPVNPALTERELWAIRSKVGPAAVLLTGVEGPAWHELMPGDRTLWLSQIPSRHSLPALQPRPDDLAVLIGTSGSSAEPRFVCLSHAEWIDGARRVVDYFGIGFDDRVLSMMPLFHNHGLSGTVLTTLLAGGQVFCPGPLDHGQLPLWLADISPTWITGAPTVLSALLDAVHWAPHLRHDMKLRFVRSASAHLHAELRAELTQKLGVPVIEIFAVTEAGGQVTAPPLLLPSHPVPEVLPAGLYSQAAGDVGVPCHRFEIAVLNEQDQPVPRGVQGEVVIRGRLTSSGYYQDEQATSELFRGGWLHTGDIGVIDGDGHLHIRGRMSDYANRGGEKLWLPHIDVACAKYAGVRAAMAFPVVHPTLGQDVSVAVVAEPGIDLDVAELRAFVRGQLPANLIPNRIEIVAELPLGPSGKVVRRLLTESLSYTQEGEDVPIEARRRSSNSRSPVEVALSVLWCEVLGVESIGNDEEFVAAGGDSILATRLIANVSEALGIDLSLEVVLGEGNTVAGMARVVAKFRATPTGGTGSLSAL
jgi:oxalate---CoA ligase